MFGLDPAQSEVKSKQDGGFIRFSVTVAFEATAGTGSVKTPASVQVTSVSADFSNQTLTVRGYYQA
jgi:hypothetical protein